MDLIVKSDALVHFDANKPIVIAANSSGYSIGVVLYLKVDQDKRPRYVVSLVLQ